MISPRQPIGISIALNRRHLIDLFEGIVSPPLILKDALGIKYFLFNNTSIPAIVVNAVTILIEDHTHSARRLFEVLCKMYFTRYINTTFKVN